MKKLTIFFFTLLSFCAIAQTKTTQTIKIFLEDAETGKNIPDARVTLEGFEIPALTAKYDKKEKVYYFDEIPPGYNTVMAYHDKYNEKGFQNTQGLPKDLKLKLYTPYRVKIPNDSLNYYKEDPSKLIIMMNDTLYRSNIRDSYLSFVKTYFKFLEYQKGDTLIDYYGYDNLNFNIKSTFPYPYVFLSNILKITGLGYPFESNNFTQTVFYKDYEGFDLERNYNSNGDFIEQIQKSDSQKLYKLKANAGSPFGIMDLIEHYNNHLRNKIYQNIEKINKL